MLKQMWATLPKESLLDSGTGSKFYREMWLEEVSKRASQSGLGLGVAQIVKRELLERSRARSGAGRDWPRLCSPLARPTIFSPPQCHKSSAIRFVIMLRLKPCLLVQRNLKPVLTLMSLPDLGRRCAPQPPQWRGRYFHTAW